jgi:transketolase
MGIAKARGFVLADRLAGRSGRVYVLTGDGELQEGQFWESLQPTANQGIHEITVIVDHNKIQSDTWVDEVSALGDIEARVAAHGWAVGRCDGNDVAAVRDGLADLRERADGRPQLLIADTRKGAGVSFMEGPRLERSPHALYAFHSGAPSREDYDAAVAELRARLPDVALESAEAPQKTAGAAPEGLVAAYERALARLGDERDDVVVLSADLRLDCGLVTFAREHPERFFECGIAEQDMVSQAGTMALAGLVPLVHSFGCFLSTRPNEQIYNNTTEGTKVVYVGSLVGLVPGGPGHSHQSVRDISALAANPGMALIEPGSPAQVERALRWAVDDASGPVYIRLVTVPWELGFDLPDEPLAAGRGTVVRPGRDATIVTTGPVMLAQAWAAIAGLADDGLDVGLIALPWLKDVDGAWLAEHCEGTVFTLDNHYLEGGQGDAVLSALQAGAEAPPRVVKLGVDRVPVCGTNAEVLREHGVDAEGVRVAIRERVGAAIAR